MADVGRIQKMYDLYVDKETAAEAITLGALVHVDESNGRVRLCDGDGSDVPPYGVALEAATAAADTLLIAWRGCVEVAHGITADDTLYKNMPLKASAGVVAQWTTATAENQYVGHCLEACTSTTAEVKIMLAGW